MKKTIVCVDDEKIILDSLHGQLQRNLGSNYNYEFAESGEEAIELINDLKKDGNELHAVISDWLMPGMKGDEFLSWVQLKFAKTNKILLTGHVENVVVQNLECCNTENITCIYKPWVEDELIGLILNESKL